MICLLYQPVFPPLTARGGTLSPWPNSPGGVKMVHDGEDSLLPSCPNVGLRLIPEVTLVFFTPGPF